MKAELAAVVPVCNEAGTVARTCRRLAELPQIGQVVLVDDGSTDGSTGIVHCLARQPAVWAAYHSSNRGKGAAVRTGLELVTMRFVVIQDADSEYDPADIPLLTAALERGARVVYGSRLLGAACRGMRPANLLANRALTALYNRIYGGRLSDLETGYKLCATALLRGLDLRATGFEVDPEISAKLARCGEKITEVPISYHGRSVRDGKKIRASDAVLAVLTLWRLRHWNPPPCAAAPAAALPAVASS